MDQAMDIVFEALEKTCFIFRLTPILPVLNRDSTISCRTNDPYLPANAYTGYIHLNISMLKELSTCWAQFLLMGLVETNLSKYQPY